MKGSMNGQEVEEEALYLFKLRVNAKLNGILTC